jgi:hypothetical protein
MSEDFDQEVAQNQIDNIDIQHQRAAAEYAEAKLCGDAPSATSDCPFDEATDPANARDWRRRHLQDFTGFLLDDEERAIRVKQLKG